MLCELTDKFVDEQDKLISYYSTKKKYLDERKDNFEEVVFKKLGDFSNFEKSNIGLIVQSINNLGSK